MSDAQRLLFGTAGVADDFRPLGYRSTEGVPEYLAVHYGLDAFEYQCGRGVRLTAENGEKIRRRGEEYGIRFSLHAPYYISMSSMDEEKRLGSIRYLLQSAAAVRALGGNRVIFHAGSCGKQSRQDALCKAKDTLQRARAALDEAGFDDILLCPETMGKVNQLGTLGEVLALCQLDARNVPCIDFGHLNARTQGSLAAKVDFAAVLDELAVALPDERAQKFHVHFSKIEYTQGGEKRHLTFADTTYGPNFEPFLELCCARALAPVVICESAGTQAPDARTMKQYYQTLCQQAGEKRGK